VVSVLFCGSRSFSAFPVGQGPVSRWLSSGGGVVCGASAGADALVVRAALAAGGASSLLQPLQSASDPRHLPPGLACGRLLHLAR
jgi:hypothetical protein